VLRSLSRDPSARFASAEELRRALAEARRVLPDAGESDLAKWAI